MTLVSILQEAYASISDGRRLPVPDLPIEDWHSTGFGLKRRLTLETLAAETAKRGLRLPVEVLISLISAVNSDKHVILTGPPGTGKTTLAEAVAASAVVDGLTSGYLLTTATSDWTTFDTVGGLRPTGPNALAFAPGQFVRAIQQQRWLVIDELNRANFDRAFGQLFTVLSGQAVELGFDDPPTGAPIQLVPEGSKATLAHVKSLPVPRAWRIIGTMNVFDKSLLFTMSYALMRRFAFIEVGAPSGDVYLELVKAQADGDEDLADRLIAAVSPFLSLRGIKELGPAIFIDMAKYAREWLRLGLAGENDLAFQLFYSYLLPQFEGLDDPDARKLARAVQRIVGPSKTARLRQTLSQVLGVEINQGVQTEPEQWSDEELAEESQAASDEPLAQVLTDS